MFAAAAECLLWQLVGAERRYTPVVTDVGYRIHMVYLPITTMGARGKEHSYTSKSIVEASAPTVVNVSVKRVHPEEPLLMGEGQYQVRHAVTHIHPPLPSLSTLSLSSFSSLLRLRLLSVSSPSPLFSSPSFLFCSPLPLHLSISSPFITSPSPAPSRLPLTVLVREELKAAQCLHGDVCV